MAFSQLGMAGLECPPPPVQQAQQHALRSLFKQAVGFSLEDAEMPRQTSVKIAVGEHL